jgi:hypothetical protein
MKVLLGNIIARMEREDIFTLKIGNESLSEKSNDNSKVCPPKNLVPTSKPADTNASPDGKAHNLIMY